MTKEQWPWLWLLKLQQRVVFLKTLTLDVSLLHAFSTQFNLRQIAISVMSGWRLYYVLSRNQGHVPHFVNSRLMVGFHIVNSKLILDRQFVHGGTNCCFSGCGFKSWPPKNFIINPIHAVCMFLVLRTIVSPNIKVFVCRWAFHNCIICQLFDGQFLKPFIDDTIKRRIKNGATSGL